MKKFFLVAWLSLCWGQYHLNLGAERIPKNPCLRPQPGSIVTQPADLRSKNGVLKVDLTIHDSTEPDGSTRYCY
ncbi:MAG: hypothetical protein WBG23_00950, partial [Acidobacteriaceae bacterium]